jgi:hypothetical protein
MRVVVGAGVAGGPEQTKSQCTRRQAAASNDWSSHLPTECKMKSPSLQQIGQGFEFVPVGLISPLLATANALISPVHYAACINHQCVTRPGFSSACRVAPRNGRGLRGPGANRDLRTESIVRSHHPVESDWAAAIRRPGRATRFHEQTHGFDAPGLERRSADFIPVNPIPVVWFAGLNGKRPPGCPA